MKTFFKHGLGLVLFAAIFVAVPVNNAHSQKLIKKELQSSSSENGKVYQWIKQSYVLGKDTLAAAFDLNGKRITPNGVENKRSSGVYYVGNGIFQISTKKKDANGNNIVTAYNTEGKCIISELLAELSDFKSYSAYGLEGLGLFYAEKYVGERTNLDGNQFSLYNTKGECLISKDEGYTYISIEEGGGLKYFSCFIYKNGKRINQAIYDLNRKPLISKREGYTWINYYEKGGVNYFFCQTEIDGKTVSEAIYDLNGKPLISKSEGYTTILVSHVNKCKYTHSSTASGPPPLT